MTRIRKNAHGRPYFKHVIVRYICIWYWEPTCHNTVHAT